MNQKAKDLGLADALRGSIGPELNDLVGADMACLISYAAEDDRIGPIMRTPEFTFHTAPVPHHRPQHNRFFARATWMRGGKTGFISKAGYCLATLLKLPEGGPSLAVVVLGANSNPGRFWETRHLLAWLSDRAQLLGLYTPAVVSAQ
jgi:D-alanyl-D-alanine carboxypeptidase